MIKRSCLCAALVLALAGAPPVLAQAEARHAIVLQAQDMGTALRLLAQQTKLQIVYSADLVQDKRAPALNGRLTVAEALDQLLQGTDLRYEFLDGQTVTLSLVGSALPSGPESSERASSSSASDLVLFEEEVSGVTKNKGDPSRITDPQATEMDTVIVTGTRIAGATPASPVTIIGRTDIERSGYADVGAVLRSVPQSFSGGQNSTVLGARGNANGNNYGLSDSPNLRGFGSDSTLVLVNGERLPLSGLQGSADISSIPLDAVDRIEILTDGASAIYGSDAVGGVVNFVLRRGFDGAVTSVQAGIPTNGGGEQIRLSHTLGGSWRRGSALINYQYSRQNKLSSRYRSFTSGMTQPNDLIPDMDSHSVYASASFDVTDKSRLMLQGMYTKRDVAQAQSDEYYLYFQTSDQWQAAGSLRYEVDLSDSWGIAVSSTLGDNNIDYASLTPGYDPSVLSMRNELRAYQVETTGKLFELPAGKIGIAAGAGRRKESVTTDIPTYGERDVIFGFGEIDIPIVGSKNARPGVNKLGLNLSARTEDYSDFGANTSFKAGLVYAPSDSISFRATRGTAFRAPTLDQLYGSRASYLADVPDPHSPTGTSVLLVKYQGNPDLGPEKATPWTVGFDWKPTGSGLVVYGTYFKTSYKQRITQPLYSESRALTDPSFNELILRNPTLEQQQEAIEYGYVFWNFSSSPYDPSTVAAIADMRYLNVSNQTANGFDLEMRYATDFDIGALELSLNSTWLKLRQGITLQSSEETLTGTIFNPPKQKVRAGATLQRNEWSGSMFVNYISPEIDNISAPYRHVSSWTTFDGQIGYSPEGGSALNGFRFSLSMENILDRSPPYLSPVSVAPGYNGLEYDSTNATPWGRVVRIAVTKEW